MLGGIIGDIVGSIYEFHNIKTKEFPLFSERSGYTDDSILSIATAQWILEGGSKSDSGSYYFRYAFNYPHPKGGYGSGFVRWVQRAEDGDFSPYNSCGNGSAMRVGPVGWAFNTREEVLAASQYSAESTHNHPEGIKGAQATALCILMARQGASKDDIRKNIEAEFGYDLDFTCDGIRDNYGWGATCQTTVPQAIVAFLDGVDFEDSIRNAISIGGDSDTLACITGSIAEAYYGIPEDLYDKGMEYLNQHFKNVVKTFEDKYGNNVILNNLSNRVYTPEKITELKPNEVFVFGSNLAGHHDGGAARLAHQSFGAVMGEGVGLHGQSYAIPTMQGGLETIKPYVDEFINFAEKHPDLKFLVTRIGCGIAGFRDEEIAPLFKKTIDLENVLIPKRFIDAIQSHLEDKFNLERFVIAQENNYERALQEIQDGQKCSDWIWYIFPQLAALGYGWNAKYYGISGYDEAEAYLNHPILGERLRTITNTLLTHHDLSCHDIFEPVDANKVRSCMTLFDAVSPDDIFQQVLDVFYDGYYDKRTLDYM